MSGDLVEVQRKRRRRGRRGAKRQKRGEDPNVPKMRSQCERLGQKDLEVIYSRTGMDPDVRRRTKLIGKAQKLSHRKK